MIRIARIGGFVVLGIFAGCGGGSLTSNPGTPPPHGGDLIILPGGRGYVEVVKKASASGKGPVTGEAAFYFLKDMATPFAPPPRSGTLTVGRKTVTLTADGDGLVTPNGPPLFEGDPDGTLSVELDGKPVNI